MPNVCIALFAPIAVMIYLKTLAVSILNAFNRHHDEMEQRPVVCGPLTYENESLSVARDKFKQSPKEEAMYHYLSKFNGFSCYSMMAYPVGDTVITSNMGKKAWRIRFYFV